MKDKLRKTLSMPGMMEILDRTFSETPENLTRTSISMRDCLLAGFAMFSLKYPSLLQFDANGRFQGATQHNLKTLYRLDKVPCDTYMRERLDEARLKEIRKAYKRVFAAVQHHRMLERFSFMNDHYLLNLDGTGCFSSHKIWCDNCCQKISKEGEVTYYHQMMGAVIAHPDLKMVLPLCPEPILQQDGVDKNDCERNAAKRLIANVRREHPHLKVIVVEDSLASNGPHIDELRAHKMSFILGVKPKDHKWLFDWVAACPPKEFVITHDEVRHRFHYVNDVPLSDSRADCRVNFLEYWEENTKTGKIQHFSWVTDLHLTKNTVYQIMRGGRARWKIENETFNTLKNQGYYFEHNFGHGHKNLTTVLAHLMFLAFLVDQVQQLCCARFKQPGYACTARIVCGKVGAATSYIILSTTGRSF